MNKSLYDLHCKLNSLVIFRNILEFRTIKSLNSLFESLETDDTVNQIKAYSDFVSNLYRHHNDLSRHILTLILEDDNICMRMKSENIVFDKKIEECLENELDTLQVISQITPEQIKESINYDGFLPEWDNTVFDFRSEYLRRLDSIDRYGFGIYAKYYMFIVNDGNILPVKHPDSIRLSDLIGYERQKKLIIDNTLALINGKPALNVLLTGDAGTGKSSSVKAIANEYRDMGLRIIEIRKDQLRDIPVIIDSLSKNPLKFILFIDDLSFADNDDSFGALKAILEGSVSARANNIAIYATSNRRHLVKENYSDRMGDDMHRNDTMQEIVSLSERFGLRITFSKPGKQEYLDIVKAIAANNGLDMPDDVLEAEAERFAIARSGRSARAAKQLVDMLIAKKI